MDLPKDRTELTNMWVIRRNLVYAVGLPPLIANEDTLRKPEYFGQYGKISKIVLNRTNVTSGDPRRASPPMTFVHKVSEGRWLASLLILKRSHNHAVHFLISAGRLRASWHLMVSSLTVVTSALRMALRSIAQLS